VVGKEGRLLDLEGSLIFIFVYLIVSTQLFYFTMRLQETSFTSLHICKYATYFIYFFSVFFLLIIVKDTGSQKPLKLAARYHENA